MQGWIVISAAAAYLAVLFAIASYGDRRARGGHTRLRHPLVYPLSLSVYCTSWTFFGSVGLASTTGYNFLAIYIGAGLMIALGYPLLRRVVDIAKTQNITSIADFIGARYGKSQTVAAIVTVIAIIGSVPYIALQLKAVSLSLITLLTETTIGISHAGQPPVIGDIALFVALALAAFVCLFGTRHIEATEHQNGMMLAIAVESVIKLAAFLTVGIFVTFFMFSGVGDFYFKAMSHAGVREMMTRTPDIGLFVTINILSFACIVLLPRQFHVTVVENNRPGELRLARWMFPLYLV
ncbi:MAG: hybrid sensor histidine kinase/response regulator, partial [Rhodobiaceae bacterium]|nr:hybrid sensor histidine kinase/response regulator [Rhodobiaceae bacterium]